MDQELLKETRIVQNILNQLEIEERKRVATYIANMAKAMDESREEAEWYKLGIDALNIVIKDEYRNENEAPCDCVARIRWERDEARKQLMQILRMHESYSLLSILDILTGWCGHLLHMHDCDHMGYETAGLALKEGAKLAARLPEILKGSDWLRKDAEKYFSREDDRHIICLRAATSEYMAGWYFSDETERLHGPFATREETVDLFNNYVKSLG